LTGNDLLAEEGVDQTPFSFPERAVRNASVLSSLRPGVLRGLPAMVVDLPFLLHREFVRDHAAAEPRNSAIRRPSSSPFYRNTVSFFPSFVGSAASDATARIAAATESIVHQVTFSSRHLMIPRRSRRRQF
jgi:hypothetical protein